MRRMWVWRLPPQVSAGRALDADGQRLPAGTQPPLLRRIRLPFISISRSVRRHHLELALAESLADTHALPALKLAEHAPSSPSACILNAAETAELRRQQQDFRSAVAVEIDQQGLAFNVVQ